MIFPNIPSPNSDQTIESLATMLLTENALPPKWMTLNKYLFGGKDIKPSSIIQNGLSHFLATVPELQFSSLEQLVREHSLVSIYQPFIQSVDWKSIINRLKNNHLGGIGNVLGFAKRSPYRSLDFYCPDCMAEEISHIGYAYAHRTHRFIGVKTCPHHGCRVGPLNESCQDVEEFHGYIIPRTDSLDSQLIQSDDSIVINQIHTNFSRWVKAALMGDILSSDITQRMQVIRSRLKEMFPGKNPGAARLNQLLLASYGKLYLAEIGYPISIHETQWTFLFLEGYGYHTDPLVNILILNILFESPEEFNRRIILTSPTHEVTQKRKPSPEIFWTYAVIKDILKMGSLKEIERKHNINIGSISLLFKLVPKLKARRKNFIYQRKIRTYRGSISHYIQNYPDCSRKEIHSKHPMAYSWILRKDSEWLDKIYYKKLNESNNQHVSCQFDSEIRSKVKDIHLHYINSAKVIWVNQTLLKCYIENKFGIKLAPSEYPNTLKTIAKLAESQKQFQSRVLSKIGDNARKGDIATCASLSSQLFDQVDSNPNMIKTIFKTVVENTPYQSDSSNDIKPSSTPVIVSAV